MAKKSQMVTSKVYVLLEDGQLWELHIDIYKIILLIVFLYTKMYMHGKVNKVSNERLAFNGQE